MGLIRFLAIAFLIYFGFKLLVRFFLPLLGKYAIKKASENMQEQAKRAQDGPKVYEQGNVTIRKPAGGNTRSKSNDEEYVDFQEID